MQPFDAFHTITPQLVVQGAAQAILFYQHVFGAQEHLRNLAPDGISIMHAELLCGDSPFFVHDEFPDQGLLSPRSLHGASVTLHVYVPNVDEVFERALAAGAHPVVPVADVFWGERYGIFTDPFGHRWSVSTRLEDLSPMETHERAVQYANEQHEQTSPVFPLSQEHSHDQ
jgi:PhnB protein